MDRSDRLAWQSLQHDWNGAYLFEYDDRPAVATPCRAWRKDTWTTPLEAATPGELSCMVQADYRARPVSRDASLITTAAAR